MPAWMWDVVAGCGAVVGMVVAVLSERRRRKHVEEEQARHARELQALREALHIVKR
jgi:hypothetical protein